ncbi:MAG TPA: hypothetical protein VGD58_10425 [Herpetosiphonaceae bacterium]
MLRHLLTAGFLVALAFSSIQPAAAATCYGSGCHGLDPVAAGCVSDAQFVRAAYTVTRYYSPSCHAYFGQASGFWTGGSISLWMAASPKGTLSFGTTPDTYSRMWTSGVACGSYNGVQDCA